MEARLRRRFRKVMAASRRAPSRISRLHLKEFNIDYHDMDTKIEIHMHVYIDVDIIYVYMYVNIYV